MNERTIQANHEREARSRGNGNVQLFGEKSQEPEVLIDEYLRFERLISDLSARFVNIAPDQVDKEIRAALEQVLEFFQVDRCGLLNISSDRKRVYVTHAAYAEGIEHVSGDIDLAAMFPWSYKILIQGLPVCFARIEELPEMADQDRVHYIAMGIRSLLDIPLFVSGKVSSIIVLNSVRQDRFWPEEFIPRLRLLGEIFVNALERRNADRALRERKAKLRLATDAAGVIPWTLDTDSGRIWTTEKGKEFFDSAPDGEITLERFLGIVHAEDREDLRRTVEETMKSGKDNSAEYRIVRPDGGIRWILSRGRRDATSSGLAGHMMGVSIDVTERKRAEETLRTSEEKFKQFFDNSPDYCYIISPDGMILDVNRSALHMLGYERDELIGKPVSMIYDPGSRAKMKELFELWRALGQIRNEEMTVITKQGEKHIVLLNVGAVRDENGTILHSTSVQTDITQIRRNEELRRESMERYRAVVDAFDGFIYICSQDYRVEFMNRRLIKRTGRDATGELCYMALHDRDSICPWCMNDRIFAGETVRWELQSPKDNCWYYVVNTPIRHIDGTISKQAMILDITERKSAEESLRKSEATLRNSQKDIRRLAGRLMYAQEEELRWLSRELHDDLTQRLAVIAIEAGKLELELGNAPHTHADTLKTLSQMKEHLINVSEDVHRISRQLHPTILDDLGLIRAIESECAVLMRKENIQVTFNKDGDFSAVDKDAALCLYRIIQEGLKNIIKHSGSGKAEIFLNDDGECIDLTIRDKGVGFDPNEVRQKPGLGLSSMRERVLLVSGDFSIESRPGHGTVIRVSIPRRRLES